MSMNGVAEQCEKCGEYGIVHSIVSLPVADWIPERSLVNMFCVSEGCVLDGCTWSWSYMIIASVSGEVYRGDSFWGEMPKTRMKTQPNFSDNLS